MRSTVTLDERGIETGVIRPFLAGTEDAAALPGQSYRRTENDLAYCKCHCEKPEFHAAAPQVVSYPRNRLALDDGARKINFSERAQLECARTPLG